MQCVDRELMGAEKVLAKIAAIFIPWKFKRNIDCEDNYIQICLIIFGFLSKFTDLFAIFGI